MNLTQTNRLLKNPDYIACINRLAELEAQRIYCCHTLAHFLDVARIAMLLCHESGLSLNPDLIYTTALLHDIGRLKEYEDGTPHHEASCAMARDFLASLDFTPSEKETILSAIASHRKGGSGSLEQVIYKADKLSRSCFACNASDTCKWSNDKKNMELNY